MIAEVLKEVSLLPETRVEPGELGVGCQISGFRHGMEVIRKAMTESMLLLLEANAEP